MGSEVRLRYLIGYAFPFTAGSTCDVTQAGVCTTPLR